jgi:superfamily I DNA/RNA helicase/mRNA-degrading endonuclease RelE of RelBE toxin-antitoxin system
MTIEWRITQKPDFFKALLALPPKETHQVLEKINLLAQDPTPDAKVKKQLKYLNGRLHRIRSGDYRIFYTFEQPYISILALRRRDDDTYDEDMDVEFLGGLDPHFDEAQAARTAQPDWERILAPKDSEKRPLPEPITEELLVNLNVPRTCHARLLLIQTQEDLLECPGVPDDYLLKIDEYMFERPLVQVLQQPDYLLTDVNDLLRYKEGELLAFLLKLSPEQEKYVTWGMNASGPTLLKGGPGTGKSTIALYRVHSLVQELRKKGRDEFRILFTTYTNALVNSSKQLLGQLLGDDVKYVEVQTADRIVVTLLGRAGIAPKFIDQGEFNNLLRQAIKVTQFEGNAVQQQAQRQTVERLSIDYLHQEINQVIVARQISSLEGYLAASRPGRKVRLNALQRKAIWKVHETLQRVLKQQGKETWRQARAMAEECVAKGIASLTYDAVVIDEAQDLDPSALRLLVRLCDKPNRIFITADANQSIYGSGFNWADVHENLRFQGRTSILHANYRSTREIGEAAQSYLAGGALDMEQVERVYMNSGPMPAVRAIRNGGEEVQLLSHFLPAAAREFRFAVGACAVLCPTINAGKAIAAELTQRGIEASFMSGQELNLSRPGVKVLTLNSAKGLEFPIVALSGFINSGWYGNGPANVGAEEREEFLATDRRTMFVGMTRAMRALLITVPAQTPSPLLQGFDGTYWNLG